LTRRLLKAASSSLIIYDGFVIGACFRFLCLSEYRTWMTQTKFWLDLDEALHSGRHCSLIEVINILAHLSYGSGSLQRDTCFSFYQLTIWLVMFTSDWSYFNTVTCWVFSGQTNPCPNHKFVWHQTPTTWSVAIKSDTVIQHGHWSGSELGVEPFSTNWAWTTESLFPCTPTVPSRVTEFGTVTHYTDMIIILVGIIRSPSKKAGLIALICPLVVVFLVWQRQHAHLELVSFLEHSISFSVATKWLQSSSSELLIVLYCFSAVWNHLTLTACSIKWLL